MRRAKMIYFLCGQPSKSGWPGRTDIMMPRQAPGNLLVVPLYLSLRRHLIFQGSVLPGHTLLGHTWGLRWSLAELAPCLSPTHEALLDGSTATRREACGIYRVWMDELSDLVAVRLWLGGERWCSLEVKCRPCGCPLRRLVEAH
jgi:hypothetical protein